MNRHRAYPVRLQARLDRQAEDAAWAAELKFRAEVDAAVRLDAALERAPMDRLAQLAGLPAIDWPAAHQALVAETVGLRAVQS